MWSIFKSPAKTSVSISEDEAIALFKEDPSKYFMARGEPLRWEVPNPHNQRPLFPDDMRVVVGERTLGYVQRVKCRGTTATIGHIAVEKSLSGRGKGLGIVIARAYAAELRERYGVNRIVFAEDHSNYHKAGYSSFFARLGASPLPVDPRVQLPERPDYEWLEQDWGV